MNKTEQLKHLRALTQAGMKDCSEALVEANGDLNKAVDIIKSKGKNIVSGREGKVASEGQVFAGRTFYHGKNLAVLVEVNCQTDFVARSPQFQAFGNLVVANVLSDVMRGSAFNHTHPNIEVERHNLIASTKENIVVRRWWVEEVVSPIAAVFSYVHAGNKLASVVTLQINDPNLVSSKEFNDLGNDLAMQVVAMNPLAITSDLISTVDLERQKAIFQAQLKEMNKPEASWDKIIAGKLNKWYSEVCLVNQESISHPKSTVQKTIDELVKKLNTQISVVNMIRVQVGEGLEVVKTDLADEVAKLMQ